MTDRRKIEIFSAGCQVCQDTVDRVKSLVCPSCEVTVLDMKAGDVAARAKALGICTVPAVVVDGRLAGGTDEASLRAAGIGQPL